MLPKTHKNNDFNGIDPPKKTFPPNFSAPLFLIHGYFLYRLFSFFLRLVTGTILADFEQGGQYGGCVINQTWLCGNIVEGRA